MAARRLLLVMLGLLGISILISFFVPNPADRADDGSTGTTGATSTTGGTGQEGRARETDSGVASGPTGSPGATGDSGAADTPASETTIAPGTRAITFIVAGTFGTACVESGSRVILNVKTSGSLDLAVPAFGRTATATRYAPAVFDLLLPDEPGRYSVEVLGTGREVAAVIAADRCARRQGPTGSSTSERPREPDDETDALTHREPGYRFASKSGSVTT